MFPVSIFALFLAVTAEQPSCEDRCTRLKQRSLSRIGYDDERLQLLFERQRPLESMKDVCWRLYDNLDCMKKCSRSEKHAVFAKHVRNKCKFVLSEMEPTLKCISKHHSFLTMRCSSFLNEASRLRAESDLSTTPRHDECRFLHLTTICLENHVNTFCPEGRQIFRRLNFRDYFLSFILPMDDDLFDDEDLDSCQIYDFVKDAEKREKEESERKLEEERRRRIEDDEDYEEELTTIVNDMEDDDVTPTMLTSTTVQDYVTSSESSSESTTSHLEKLETTTSSESSQKEFTTLLDDLITSSENSENSENSEITRTPSEQESSTENLESIENRHDLDSLLEKIHEESTTPSESTTTTPDPVTPSEYHYSDAEYDHHYDEEYHDAEADNSTHPTISVVSIESRISSEDVDVTTPDEILNLSPPVTSEEEEEGLVKIETSTKRKVFSEDSMENTPPNFFYSSNRYDTTTGRSNYVVDNFDKEDSEEPLEIDTSTLFGIEPTLSTTVPSEVTVIPTTTKKIDGKPRPWLQGGVIVKPILNFDQMDVDLEEEREREHRENQNKTMPTASSEKPSEDVDDFLSESEGPSTNETLIVIGLIALVVCLIFLIVLLLLAYFCSARSDNYNVQKDEGSPPV